MSDEWNVNVLPGCIEVRGRVKVGDDVKTSFEWSCGQCTAGGGNFDHMRDHLRINESHRLYIVMTTRFRILREAVQ